MDLTLEPCPASVRFREEPASPGPIFGPGPEVIEVFDHRPLDRGPRERSKGELGDQPRRCVPPAVDEPTLPRTNRLDLDELRQATNGTVEVFVLDAIRGQEAHGFTGPNTSRPTQRKRDRRPEVADQVVAGSLQHLSTLVRALHALPDGGEHLIDEWRGRVDVGNNRSDLEVFYRGHTATLPAEPQRRCDLRHSTLVAPVAADRRSQSGVMRVTAPDPAPRLGSRETPAAGPVADTPGTGDTMEKA